MEGPKEEENKIEEQPVEGADKKIAQPEADTGSPQEEEQPEEQPPEEPQNKDVIDKDEEQK